MKGNTLMVGLKLLWASRAASQEEKLDVKQRKINRLACMRANSRCLSLHLTPVMLVTCRKIWCLLLWSCPGAWRWTRRSWQKRSGRSWQSSSACCCPRLTRWASRSATLWDLHWPLRPALNFLVSWMLLTLQLLNHMQIALMYNPCLELYGERTLGKHSFSLAKLTQSKTTTSWCQARKVTSSVSGKHLLLTREVRDGLRWGVAESIESWW